MNRINKTVANLEFKIVCPDLKRGTMDLDAVFENRVVCHGQAIEQFRSEFSRPSRLFEDGAVTTGEVEGVKTITFTLEMDEGDNVSNLQRMSSIPLRSDSWNLIFHREPDQMIFTLRSQKKTGRFYFENKMAEAIKNHPLP